MKRAAAVLAFVAATAHAQPSCPTKPPNPFGVKLTVACDPCLAGQPVTIEAVPNNSPCLLQPYDCLFLGPYAIQSCDTLAWNFGDGSPAATFAGNPSATHTFAAGGSYIVSVDVANSMGSVTRSLKVLVGNSAPTTVTPDIPPVTEGSGSLVIQLNRTGNLAGTSDFDYVLTPLNFQFPHGNGDWYRLDTARAAVHFASGEAQKTLSFPILRADSVWTGPTNFHFELTTKDATLIAGMQPDPYDAAHKLLAGAIADDDPRPHLQLKDLQIVEGDLGSSFARVEAALDVPSGLPSLFQVNIPNFGDDIQSVAQAQFAFAPGQLSALATIAIKADRAPEPDDVVTFGLLPGANPLLDPVLDRPSATLTILNDDIGFGSAAQWMNAGDSITVPLDLGTPLTTDAKLTIVPDTPSIKVTPSIGVGETAGTLTIEALQGLDTQLNARLESPQRVSTGTLLVHVFQPAVLVSRPESIQLRVGEETAVRISFAPAQAVTAMVTAQSQSPGIVSVVNATVETPPGEEAVFKLRGLSPGKTSLIVYSPGQPASKLVPVEVLSALPRRRAAKP